MARSEFNPQWGRCSVRAFSLLLLPSPSSSHHRHHHHHPIIAIIIIIPSLITIIITSPSSQHHCNPCHHYHHSHHHHHPQTTTMSTLGECCVHEIMWYVTFGEWLFSPLSIMPLRFIEVAVYINSFFFFFTASCISLHGYTGFPDTSVDKESACNAGDPGLFPGSGRSVGEGIGYPLQYSWASLVAQLIKNLPAMWETWS